jgi:archaemetzincin
VLPGDDLALDASYPPQSLRAWLREKERNKVTPERKTIYVAAPPDVDPEVEFIRAWTQPLLRPMDAGTAASRPKLESAMTARAALARPRVEDVVDYLSAFYHGLPVTQLPLSKVKFTSWDGSSGSSKAKARSMEARFIGLNTSTECVRIRTRASVDNVFSRQLNLDDLLDAAISMLPEDAHALFEDEDDIFVCGRAYGGSRVAVISTARYNPELDSQQKVEREHAWPASHCEQYLQSCLAAEAAPPQKVAKRAKKTQTQDRSSEASIFDDRLPGSGIPSDDRIPALQAAVLAHSTLPSLQTSPSTPALSGLWLGRVCRTASHELGHCFGIDHCIYYACAMQGSASITEDARQPPYLCPVDLAKMLRATAADPRERYTALLAYCDRRTDTHLFAAYAAWIRARILELETGLGF